MDRNIGTARNSPTQRGGTVLGLGIFDSDQNGIAALADAPLSAYLFNSDHGVVAFRTFDITLQGTLDVASKYRFKPITPVTLLPGTYVLVGYGWTGDDLEHNIVNGGVSDTFHDGGGLITYRGSPFGGGGDAAGTWIGTGDGSPNFFSSANMQFDTTIPEPATLLLLGSGLAGLGAPARFRRRS